MEIRVIKVIKNSVFIQTKAIKSQTLMRINIICIFFYNF